MPTAGDGGGNGVPNATAAVPADGCGPGGRGRRVRGADGWECREYPVRQSAYVCPTPELEAAPDPTGDGVLLLTPVSCGELIGPLSWKRCIELHQQVRDFLVSPGDYSGWGVLDISKSSGLPGRRRVIRYFGAGADRHPVQRAADGDGNEALLQAFRFSEARHWLLHGLKIVPGVPMMQDTGQIAHHSSDIVLDSLLIEHIPRNAVRIRQSNDNCVQNSVIRTANPAVSDRVGVNIRVRDSATTGNRIVNNEIIDFGDAIQLTDDKRDPGLTADGTVVAENDLYVTEGYLARLDDGAQGCVENALDIKIGAAGAENPVRIIGNRIWGYRRIGVGICGGSGEAVVVQRYARHIILSQNVIFDVPIGVRSEVLPRGVAGSRNLKIDDNLFYGIRAFDAGKLAGAALSLPTPAEVRGNTLSHSDSLTVRTPAEAAARIMRENTALAVRHLVPALTESGSDNTRGGTVAQGVADYTFPVRRWTAPSTVTLPLALGD